MNHFKSITFTQETIIREAKKEDSKTLSSLIEQVGYIIPPIQAAEKIKAFAQINKDKIWVAQTESGIVGVLALNIFNLLHQAGIFARIDLLVVDAQYRKRGIATALVITAKVYTKEIGCTRIILTSSNHCTAAHAFYKKMKYLAPNVTYFTKDL